MPSAGDWDPAAVPAALPGVDDRAAGRGRGGEAWKEGRSWRIGGDEDVRWITANTSFGLTIASAIPPVFEAYATVVVPDVDDQVAADDALLALLRAQSAAQPWWLGYLETGGSDVVFPDAPRVWLYAEWDFVMVEAGPDEAATWRTYQDSLPWHGALPELMFPLDRSWLVSTLWDDDWRCVGGPTSLVEGLLAHPLIDSRLVSPSDDDATPPGHHAR